MFRSFLTAHKRDPLRGFHSCTGLAGRPAQPQISSPFSFIARLAFFARPCFSLTSRLPAVFRIFRRLFRLSRSFRSLTGSRSFSDSRRYSALFADSAPPVLSVFSPACRFLHRTVTLFCLFLVFLPTPGSLSPVAGAHLTKSMNRNILSLPPHKNNLFFYCRRITGIRPADTFHTEAKAFSDQK